MSDLPYLTRMHSLSLSLFPWKWAPLGIRFDPPRLFDVSVPPQLPRPTACLLAWPPHYHRRAGLRHSMGKIHATYRANECASATRPHLELVSPPPSEYIQQDGSVPSLTQPSQSVLAMSDAPTLLLVCARACAVVGCTSCPTRALDVS